jgi:protein-S-isoprenylcysteine O-methyltransferase Ste14
LVTNPTIDRSRLAMLMIVRAAIGFTVMDGLLFMAAGRTDWRAPWPLTAVFAVFAALGAVWFLRHDADLLVERLTRRPNVPSWDRALVAVYYALLAALLVTAGLDAGRARWSHVPESVQAAGLAGVIAAFALIWWCSATNHFLSADVRIQRDRGHTVVRSGPYQYVRHPMYVGILILVSGMALALGSWLALAPATLIVVVFSVRITLEERLLRAELAGYDEYTREVRARLIPGVW